MSSFDPQVDQVKTIIVSQRGRGTTWGQLIRYRKLAYLLTWRDLKVRYKQTLFGFGWAFFKPLLGMLVFTWVFHRAAGLQSPDQVPYPLLVLIGLLPWQLFSTVASESGTLLLSNAGLINKVFFPRMLIPVSLVLTALADFLVSSLVLVFVMVFYAHLPPVQVIFLPVFLGLQILLLLGLSWLFSALQVRYRGLRFVLTFGVQMAVFISPIGFSSSVVDPGLRWLYALNPMVGLIDGYRWCALGQEIHIQSFMVSICVDFALFFLGAWYFRKTEDFLSDLL